MMKNWIKSCLIWFLAIPISMFCQDSLTMDQIEPLSYYFDIKDGGLIGPGGFFLRAEMANAQFTMIGEYHGSSRISELTEAIIPILDSIGYKTMVLEVGPITGKVLDGMGPDVQSELKNLIEKYMITEEDGYINPPFPFFEHNEDARFLQKAKDMKWEVIGIDQEYYYGYRMLFDLMYSRLSLEDQNTNQALYLSLQDSMHHFHDLDIKGERDLTISIKESAVVDSFLMMASKEESNHSIIEALRKSNQIYWLNHQRRWYENNSARVRYMKSQLKKQLSEKRFDIAKDKLLIKMGGYHLSKGFTPLALYEVGTTLNELAEYHGNSSLNITFSNRFYMEDGEIKDILDEDNAYLKNFRVFHEVGKMDQWVVIDLRSLIEGHFYRPVKYHYNDQIEDLVKRYDLLIIPKLEKSPTPNYELNK